MPCALFSVDLRAFFVVVVKLLRNVLRALECLKITSFNKFATFAILSIFYKKKARSKSIERAKQNKKIAIEFFYLEIFQLEFFQLEFFHLEFFNLEFFHLEFFNLDFFPLEFFHNRFFLKFPLALPAAKGCKKKSKNLHSYGRMKQ